MKLLFSWDFRRPIILFARECLFVRTSYFLSQSEIKLKSIDEVNDTVMIKTLQKVTNKPYVKGKTYL